jgi:hypothetical protein
MDMRGWSTMKKAMLLCMVLALPLCCKTEKQVVFCEGVTPEGKGVKCGTTFSTGDVTALIQVKENFEAESIQLKVYEHKQLKDELLESHALAVKPDGRSATTNLSFYNEGAFKVIILGKEDREIGNGEIKVVDTY